MNKIDNTDIKKAKKDMSWTSFFILLVVIILFRLFVLEPHTVSGSSMDNTFKDGDYLIVDKISYRFKKPEKGDVVVFDPPKAAENNNRFIKRVIATPGESIEVRGGDTYINNNYVAENYIDFKSQKDSESLLLNDNDYFVMGDNRLVSYDSRYWGPVQEEGLEGRVLIRLYPFNKIQLFPGIKEYKENN